MPTLTICDAGYALKVVRVRFPTTLAGFDGHVGGYRDDDGKAACVVSADDGPTHTLNPLSPERPIAAEFAAIAAPEFEAFADEKGICAFAARYGPLGVPTRDLEDARLPGEPLTLWLEQGRRVADVLRCDQVMRDAGAHELKLPLREQQDRASTVASIASARAEELAAMVSSHIERFVTPRFSFDASDAAKGYGLVYEPSNLLGVIWLQCAWTLMGTRDYRTCKHCGRWLVTGVEGAVGKNRGKRRGAGVCDDSCRAAFRQATIQQAGEMRRAGVSLRAIATKFDRPLATIRQWQENGWRTSRRLSLAVHSVGPRKP